MSDSSPPQTGTFSVPSFFYRSHSTNLSAHEMSWQQQHHSWENGYRTGNTSGQLGTHEVQLSASAIHKDAGRVLNRSLSENAKDYELKQPQHRQSVSDWCSSCSQPNTTNFNSWSRESFSEGSIRATETNETLPRDIAEKASQEAERLSKVEALIIAQERAAKTKPSVAEMDDDAMLALWIAKSQHGVHQ